MRALIQPTPFIYSTSYYPACNLQFYPRAIDLRLKRSKGVLVTKQKICGLHTVHQWSHNTTNKDMKAINSKLDNQIVWRNDRILHNHDKCFKSSSKDNTDNEYFKISLEYF